jgi:hypothetical protein
MISKSRQAQVARARIEEFGPMPTVRQQIITLAAAGAAMLLISGTMAHFGLI